jgi:hypothetical protein
MWPFTKEEYDLPDRYLCPKINTTPFYIRLFVVIKRIFGILLEGAKLVFFLFVDVFGGNK